MNYTHPSATPWPSHSVRIYGLGKISLGTVYIIFYYTNLLTQPIDQIRMQLQDLQKAA